jgi:hypothetical protein
MATVMDREMTKPRGRPRKSERDDVTTKVDRGLMAKAKVIAAHRKITAVELISELLKGPIDKAYAQLVKEINESGSRP